jgi:hypothetical protein
MLMLHEEDGTIVYELAKGPFLRCNAKLSLMNKRHLSQPIFT